MLLHMYRLLDFGGAGIMGVSSEVGGVSVCCGVVGLVVLSNVTHRRLLVGFCNHGEDDSTHNDVCLPCIALHQTFCPCYFVEASGSIISKSIRV